MKPIIYIFLYVVCAQLCVAQEKVLSDRQVASSVQKAVLITGASSGIGRNIAETLAEEGYFVYAGARKKADLDALNAIKNIQAVRLDVTVQKDIDAAVETIRKQGRGLYGLVNNAGVAVLGPLVELTEKDMQFQMDVNVLGPYRITKAFAPLIIESKGRITTVGSVSGIVSGSMFGAYSMSKYAVEAFTDALASEMRKFDVQVSVIEPGNYNSKVISSMRRRMTRNGLSLEDSLFREEMQNLLDRWTADRSHHKEPDEVAAAVKHALFDEQPKLRYLVVPKQGEAEFTIKAAIRKVVQLNTDHPYSYDRETLISMLEEVLAR